jgi:hypothetical protein
MAKKKTIKILNSIFFVFLEAFSMAFKTGINGTARTPSKIAPM